MATMFNVGLTNGGSNTFRVPFSDFGSKISLSASGSSSLTVPAGDFDTALFGFTPGASVWVGVNDAPVVTTPSWTSCKDDLSPVIRPVSAGDVIYFLAVDASEIKVSFYKMDI